VPPPHTQGLSPSAIASIIAGTAVVLLVGVAGTLAVADEPSSGVAIGAFGVAVGQIVLLLALAAYLFAGPRTRLYGWLAVGIAFVVTAQAVVVGSLAPDSGLSLLLRSPVGLIPVLAVALFDTGRPSTRVDRLVTVPAVLAQFLVITVLLITSTVTPGAWSGLPCPTPCPTTGMGLADSDTLAAVLKAMYAGLRVVAFAAMAIGIIIRLRRARGLMRSVLRVVCIVGVIYAVVGIGMVLPVAGGFTAAAPDWVDPLLVMMRLLVPVGIASAIAIGAIGGARMGDVAGAAIRSAGDPGTVAARAGDALVCDSLRVHGAPDAPAATPGRECIPLTGPDGRVVGWFDQPAGLGDDQPLLHPGVVSAAAVAMDQIAMAREIADREERLATLRESLATAGDAERARIEQDIHDGAQARLLLLKARVRGLAGASGSDDAFRAQLAMLERDADSALADIRAISSGLRPLAPGDLMGSLHDHVLELPIRIAIEDHGIGVLPDEVEVAMHYCLRESLQNVMKHAGPGAAAAVELGREPSGIAWFAVADDGPGPGGREGVGITGMRDRLRALGGDLTLGAREGGGTVVRGHVPLGNTYRAAEP
jgi:signal transduction histidine kinase